MLFKCPYSKRVGNGFIRRSVFGFWQTMEVSTVTLGDVRLGDIIEDIGSYPYWGLHWVVLTAFTWHIWGERNRKYKENRSKPLEILSLRDVDVRLECWPLQSS